MKTWYFASKASTGVAVDIEARHILLRVYMRFQVYSTVYSLLTQEFRDAGVDVEDVVAEEGRVLRLAVVFIQQAVEEPLALGLVLRAAGQPSADLHHQAVGEELQTVHGCPQPLVCPAWEERERWWAIPDGDRGNLLEVTGF